MNKNNLIHSINPIVKLFILLIITIIGSLDFYPFLSGVLIIAMVIIAPIFSEFSLKEVLASIKVFLGMALSFMFIISLVKYLSQEELDLIVTLGLGFRIILISLYSSIFVKTTDPSEFVISMIKYLKVPEKHGFAFLSAYRFLPSFKDELEIIKYSYQVRGIEESKNPFKQIWNSKRYIVPMLITAIRKGTRVSMAMELRAFGKYDKRTYYRECKITKKDVFIGLGFFTFIIFNFYLLSKNNLTKFRLIYKG